MVKFLQEDKPENFVSSYRHARALQLLMHRVDTTYNQQARQKGIALGTKHLLPTFNRLFESAAPGVTMKPIRRRWTPAASLGLSRKRNKRLSL